MHTHKLIYMYTCTYMYLHRCVYLSIYIYTYTCMFMYIYIYLYTSTHKYVPGIISAFIEGRSIKRYNNITSPLAEIL